MARLFISHAGPNSAAAMALCEWLSGEGYTDVFLDIDPKRGIAPSDRWQKALKAAAYRCKAVLCLLSPAWLDRSWCQTEFRLATQLDKRIFGVVVEAVPFEQLPPELTAEWQLCKLVGEGPFRRFEVDVAGKREHVAFQETGLDLLRLGLERAGLDTNSFPWPPPDEPTRAPYRGLKALDRQDAAIFFGRDAEIVRGIDRIRGLAERGIEKLLVVLGASGAGKSSFLRAGLWPRLARDDTNFLPLPVIRPQTAVISGSTGLATALTGAFERFGVVRSPGRVKEALAAGSAGFGQLLDELLALAKHRLVAVEARVDPAIILALDQADELFDPDGAAEAATFLDLLAGVLVPLEERSARRILVVVTMRSDRYDQFQAEPRLVNAKRAIFDLPHIPQSEFKSIIEGPRQRAVENGVPLVIDPALTERLTADAKGADALPLLGFTLERLYADYGGDGRLTVAEYEKLGGVQGSIEAAVGSALAELGRSSIIPAAKEAQLAALRAAFIPWLARIDPETGAPIRRVACREEIPEASRPIIERFVDARLLVTDRRADINVIEVAHESLLRQWPTLAGWLKADATDLKIVEDIERAAGEWVRSGRLEAWLDHRGDRLAAAERLFARADFYKRIGGQGVAYLTACLTRAEAERQAKEEAQTALRTAHVNILGGVASHERLRGSLHGGLRLAIHAARLGFDLDGKSTGVLLARAGLAASLAEIESRFRLNGQPKKAVFVTLVAVLRGHDHVVNSARFSPDGSRVVTASGDYTARIWDIATAKQIAVLPHERWVVFATFNSSGTRILTASSDETARIWNAATGEPIAVLRGHGNEVRSASFSPDGSWVITASWDGTARIWNALTGEQVAVLGHKSWVNSAEFSPDGSRVVTASVDHTVRIWNALKAKQIAVLKGHDDQVQSAAFSRDGTRIVTASWDNTARIWNATGAKLISVLRGHTDAVSSAAFSPDQTRILTGSQDGTARIWDAGTAEEIGILQHEHCVTSAAFSPDGLRIVTGVFDGRRLPPPPILLNDFSQGAVGVIDRAALIWTFWPAEMPLKALVSLVCKHHLRGRTRLTRTEMRLAGYPDSMPAIDVCTGIE